MKDKLNDWERLAVETALEHYIGNGSIHKEHGQGLLEKIRGANHVELTTYPGGSTPKYSLSLG